MKSISPKQFALFRVALGVYLAWHFATLVPYGPELFSDRGVFGDPRLNFTYGILPNPLERWDSPEFVTVVLVVLLCLAICLALGLFRRTTAVLLWFGWAALFNRNNLINNPSIPYIGLLLVLTTIVPTGESLLERPANRAWKFPEMVYWTAWILMAAGYSFSGSMKLCSPSWIDGSALFHILNNPLARCGPIRDFLLGWPAPCLRLLTWLTLAAEISCLPLSFSSRARMIAWCSLVLINLGILFAINFTDLTIGMLMVHLFTYDPSWFRDRMLLFKAFRLRPVIPA